MFGKDVVVQFTVRVARERLSRCMCSLLELRVGCGT